VRTSAGFAILDARLRDLAHIPYVRTASPPALSPDETLVVAAVDDAQLVLASADGVIRQVALTGRHMRTDVSFSQDGSVLFVARYDDYVRPERVHLEMRDVASAEVVGSALEGQMVHVSPDRTRAILCDGAQAVAVDLASSQRTERLCVNQGEVPCPPTRSFHGPVVVSARWRARARAPVLPSCSRLRRRRAPMPPSCRRL
jgi:hypothetical protein